MIQEYSALIIFGLAILYMVFQVARFFFPGKKHAIGNCGTNSCGCSTGRKKTFQLP